MVAEQRRETALGDAHHVITDSVTRSILGSIDIAKILVVVLAFITVALYLR